MKLKITAYHRGMLYPCYGGMPNGGIAMHHTEEYKNHDELKGRFTVWLEMVVRNAKINYIKRLKRQPPTLYLEEIPESALPAQNIAADVYTKSEFEFEEEMQIIKLHYLLYIQINDNYLLMYFLV